MQTFVSALDPPVTFPIMGVVDVKGDDADPLYTFLQGETNSAIKWNFAKFLVNKEGKPVKFYAHGVDPNDMIADIEGLLNE